MNSTEEDIRELVIARLSSLPADKEISIGSDGGFKRDELIEHIEKGDAIGKKMIDVEMGFLRSLKDGSFFYSISALGYAAPYLSRRRRSDSISWLEKLVNMLYF